MNNNCVVKTIIIFFLLGLYFAGFSQGKKKPSSINAGNNKRMIVADKVGSGVTIIKVSSSTVPPVSGASRFVIQKDGARTSAGVYRASDGVMVRTLWSSFF